MRAPLTSLALLVELTHSGVALIVPGLVALGGAVGVGILLDRAAARSGQRTPGTRFSPAGTSSTEPTEPSS